MSLSPRLFKFLRDLARHNDRDWFEENRERYEMELRAPLLGFISDFGPRLSKVSKRVVADPRPVGGSLFRIHRDIRFSKDKTPYKTHAGIHFRHEDTTRDVHGPGYYLHLEPGNVFVAGGIWRPEPESLTKIRNAIEEDPARWKKAVRGLELGGDALKRTPRGFDPEHELADVVRRTDFITSVELDEKSATSARFATDVERACKKAAPLMAFLSAAVGLRF